MKPLRLTYGVAAVVVALDQLSKVWVVEALPGNPITLIGEDFLRLRYVINSGAAFGMLRDFGTVLGILAVFAVILIVAIGGRLERRADAVAIGFVLGGALGNLIDRIVRGTGFLDGGVVDFIDFNFFPTFNVADIAISLGAIAVVALSLRK